MRVFFNRLLALATVWLLGPSSGITQAANWLILGDSLSAEYDTLPEVPGVENPTAYAAITVEGWESINWVEILGRLRSSELSFGDYETTLPGWGLFRFTGYEFNFAIPGFTAEQFKDIATSSFLSHQEYVLYRASIEAALKEKADHVVVWLGANEFRGNYGYLYGGGDPAGFLNELRDSLVAVVDFIQDQDLNLPVTLVTLPDLGASPDKQQAHPDPAGRALVSEVTRQANQIIAEIAAARGFAVADVFAQTQRLLDGEVFYFGAVNILPGLHPDNHPRYHFTRDGLHPNTPLQFEIARTILAAFNDAYAGGTPVTQLTDGEALDLLGLDPNLPYWEWIEPYAVDQAEMGADPDADGYPNLTEYAFGTDPTAPGPLPITWSVGPEGFQVRLNPDPSRSRHVHITARHSPDLLQWDTLPEGAVQRDEAGELTVQMETAGHSLYLQFRAMLLPPAS